MTQNSESDEDQEYRNEKMREYRHETYVKPFLETVPVKFRSASFDAIRPTPEQKQIWSEVKITWEDAKGLFISGNVGTGKTLLAVLCGRHLAESEKHVRFENMTSLLVKIQMSYGGGKIVDYDECLNIDTLIIDDIGKERLTDWSGQIIYDIINTRTENLRRTIITSNFTPTQIIAKLGDNYGQAIVSRLAEACQFFELKGKDQRLKSGGREG